MRDQATDEGLVLQTVRALEAADAPLRPRDWPALEDPHIRELVGGHLKGLGRQLVAVTHGDGGPIEGWLSGWSDEVAAELAGDETDLVADDFAVLALIYLHSEVLVRILGEDVPPVLEQLDQHTGPDGRDTVRGQRLTKSLRRLRAHQLITNQNKLGPALMRLTPTQSRILEGNLVLLLRPDSLWARDIKAARRPESTLTEEE
ncbi:hypothetical protein SK803_37200 [Lentzea sp. BCCO 10_0856]|uniref:Uncharacterized protein n=1 Tax=Lentzea miocenica TaxID=3095431 RepID=A0ABU4TCI5_9PSEU|nr:hypothetical protein [Lentzea sp. BCCO 10_0856]MDX8035868.1 hypothetical protein [Lentzea sp. BCCO 10_0856]